MTEAEVAWQTPPDAMGPGTKAPTRRASPNSLQAGMVAALVRSPQH